MKKFLLTGATGYLGSRIAKHFAREGASLLLCGRNKLELAKLKNELLKFDDSIDVEIVQLDLENRGNWDSAAQQFVEYAPTVFFNCAGIQGKIDSITNLEIADFERVMNVNLFSGIFFTIEVTKRANPKLPLRIIHFSGGGASSPRPNFAPYSLSKTALVRFVENFASEVSRSNFSINAVAPGILPSKMQSEIVELGALKDTKDFKEAVASIGRTEQDHTRLIKLLEFLSSNISLGITGRLISAEWDAWENWPEHLKDLQNSDLYRLRRITARDKNYSWGDR